MPRYIKNEERKCSLYIDIPGVQCIFIPLLDSGMILLSNMQKQTCSPKLPGYNYATSKTTCEIKTKTVQEILVIMQRYTEIPYTAIFS
jgi:hypothetical protein